MELLKQLITRDMDIVQGRIVHISGEGKLIVKCDGGLKISCDFLRTSACSPPQLYLGTQVLCIAGETRGYVLGVVQPYIAGDESPEKPETLKLQAAERIELTCGESHLSMKKDGKIVLRGANITTRASAQNKIKGTTVSIN